MMDDRSLVCELTYGTRRRTAEISKNEFRVLEPSQYLNDKIIMFQLMFVQHYVIDESLRNQVYIADPQFFTKLKGEGPQALKPGAKGDLRQQIKTNYNTVKRWTKRDDLFRNRFLIVPICENSHWFMAIVNRMDLVE